MSTSDTPSGEVARGAPFIVRVLRTICFGVCMHPLALVVAGVCIGVLAHMISNIAEASAAGHAWSFSQVCCCGGCMALLTLVALLATGYVVLTLTVGWKSSRS